MEKELVSIIVPIYNTEDYLDRCIKSIINQDYQNLEIILVDDGSLDGSGKICDDFALKDKRIKVIHRKNGGQSAARNSGLKIATGNYIGFVDSDDSIDFDCIRFLLNLIKQYDSDMSVCETRHIGWPNQKDKKVENKDVFICSGSSIAYNFLLGLHGLVASANHMLLRASCCNKLYFLEGVIFEDLEFTIQLSFRVKKIASSPIPKYNYFYRKNNSRSINTKKRYDNLKFVYKNIKEILKTNDDSLLPILENRYISNCIHYLLVDLNKEEYYLLNIIRDDLLLKKTNEKLLTKSTYILYKSLKLGKNCFLTVNSLYKCFKRLKNLIKQ